MAKDFRQKILQSISVSGPISIAQYMHLCNSHPEHGYYATGNPVGKKGDFITAPEVSQMFGELIALWCISAWKALGCPNPVQIVELGPGRGTLMNDIIRTAKTDPGFTEAIRFNLIETSPSLKKEQQQTLADCKASVAWLETIENLQPIPAVFVANEFLDAIPFRQFIKNRRQWLELCVGISKQNQSNKHQLGFVIGPSRLDEVLLPPDHKGEPEGAIFEYALAREAISILIAQHIKNHGGTALVIDYGHEKSGFGDTFQAVRSHQSVSPLTSPGKCDLTSHVDFQAISKAVSQIGIEAGRILTQGEFLLNLGLLERAGRLGHGKPVVVQQQIQQDAERLASDDQMGKLFKVICLTKPGCSMPLFEKSDVE